MQNLIANPRSAAIVALIMALPCVLLFSLIVLNIEPNFGPLEPLLVSPDPDQPDVGGTLFALTAFVLLIAAFVISALSVRHAAWAGEALLAHPLNLLLAVALLVLIAWILGAIIVDQYPCWVGVPNCD